jgi:hypothetical protein
LQPIRTWDHLGFSFLSFNLFLAYPTQEHRTIIHLRIGELHVTTRLHHGSQAWGWQDHNVRPTAESTEVLAPPPPPLTHRQLATGTTSHMPPEYSGRCRYRQWGSRDALRGRSLQPCMC